MRKIIFKLKVFSVAFQKKIFSLSTQNCSKGGHLIYPPPPTMFYTFVNTNPINSNLGDPMYIFFNINDPLPRIYQKYSRSPGPTPPLELQLLCINV